MMKRVREVFLDVAGAVEVTASALAITIIITTLFCYYKISNVLKGVR